MSNCLTCHHGYFKQTLEAFPCQLTANQYSSFKQNSFNEKKNSSGKRLSLSIAYLLFTAKLKHRKKAKAFKQVKFHGFIFLIAKNLHTQKIKTSLMLMKLREENNLC